MCDCGGIGRRWGLENSSHNGRAFMIIKSIYKGRDNRMRATVEDDNGILHLMSYPRILMAEKLGRPLKPYEDVHHIDGNTLNNSLDNLEVIPHGEHQRMHSRKYFDKVMICPICKKEFMWTALQQKYFCDNQRRKNMKFNAPFCSKRCVGLYGRQGQIRRNSNAECVLNGETSPNGNPVPITESSVSA